MNGNNYKINKRTKDLIILCTANLKGRTKREIVDGYLPLTIGETTIYGKDNRIIVEKSKQEIADIWSDGGYYSNLEVMEKITPIWGIKNKGVDILELMKYRNQIIGMLL